MNGFKPYPKYKDSGVEWLGQVPEGWEVKRIKYAITRGSDGIKIGPFGSALKDKTLQVGPYKIYNQANLINTFDVNRHFIDKDTFDELHSYEIKQYDVLLSMMGTIGKCKIMPPGIQRGIMDSHLIKLRLNDNVLPKFFEYFYDKDNSVIVISQLECRSIGTTMNGLNSEIVKNIFILIPQLSEQQAIAAFLDQATAHIDTVISKQQRLIELLQEKRKALISHVVTKGLNPNAPMKDSGVEWLGNIPSHWDLRRTKYLFSIKKRIVGTLGFDVLSITQQGVQVKDIEASTGQFSMDYSKYQLVERGDFAMNHMDLLTGFVDISNYDGVTSPDYRVFSLLDKPQNSPLYFLYIFQNGYFNKIFYALGQGVSLFGRWRLPAEQFNNFILPVPPKNEQKAIVDYLEDELSKISALIDKAQRAIALSKEYRAALISAAVTGKICVTKPQATAKPLTKSREYFQKVVLAAEITAQLHQEPTFGRVKLQKILYLSEYHAQLPFQYSEYQRYAAGPHDPKVLYSIEAQMKKQKLRIKEDMAATA